MAYGQHRYYIFKNGKHVRVPAVSSILKVVGDSGGLENWHFKQGVEAVMQAVGGLVEKLDDEPIRPSRIFREMPPFPESAWEMPKDAAEVGTIVHLMIECDVLGKEFVEDVWPPARLAEAKVAFGAWLAWKQQQEFVVEATELELVSNAYEYGGRQDLTRSCISATTGRRRRVLLDAKTGGIYPEHLMQLAAYGNLWMENFPDRPLDAFALLRLGKVDGGFRYEEQPASGPTMQLAWSGFLAARSVYATLGGLKKAIR